jgi:hypothetical protein
MQGDRGQVPEWLAVLAYNQMRKAGVEDGHFTGPSFAEILSAGGFLPLPFVDLLAGGNGTGLYATKLYARPTTLLAQSFMPVAGVLSQHVAIPFDLAAAVLRSPAPFPVEGGRVGDGTGVDRGSIPRWLALLAHGQMTKGEVEQNKKTFTTLAALERAGGFLPLQLMDLLCGGDGRGAVAGQLYQSKDTFMRRLMPLAKIGAVEVAKEEDVGVASGNPTIVVSSKTGGA